MKKIHFQNYQNNIYSIIQNIYFKLNYIVKSVKVSRFFPQEINSFNQKRRFKLIKSVSEDIYNVAR